VKASEALKARNAGEAICRRRDCAFCVYYFAPSALQNVFPFYLGRCPRLLHFAPLALGTEWLYDNAQEIVPD
jgi:hypothetical protein